MTRIQQAQEGQAAFCLPRASTPPQRRSADEAAGPDLALGASCMALHPTLRLQRRDRQEVQVQESTSLQAQPAPQPLDDCVDMGTLSQPVFQPWSGQATADGTGQIP